MRGLISKLLYFFVPFVIYMLIMAVIICFKIKMSNDWLPLIFLLSVIASILILRFVPRIKFNPDEYKPPKAAPSKPQILPGYLVKPADPMSMEMFGNNLTGIKNRECGYYIEINGLYQNKIPERKSDSDMITHIYGKEEVPWWYAISTMNNPAVKTSPLEGSVMHPYRLSQLMNVPSVMVTMPSGRAISEYESYGLHELEASEAYNAQRKLDESKVYCHIFNLNGVVYKDYILCARKGDFAWKLECYIESPGSSKEIAPVDFAPPGFLFGGFKPL